VERVRELSKYRGRYHYVPALYSIDQPQLSLYSSSASSWGTPRDSSSEELTSGVESSGLAPAARPSNGGKGTGPTPASRTDTGLQASQFATNKSDKSVITALSGRKRGRPRKAQRPKPQPIETSADKALPIEGRS
jgi:hypothetical protein